MPIRRYNQEYSPIHGDVTWLCMLFLKFYQRPSAFHFVGSEEKLFVQRETRLFRSWNTLPCAQNFKPKFEFQTSLAQNSPVGTSELLPFGANLDLPWDWIFPEILLVYSSLIFPVGVYYASPFLGSYIDQGK